MKEFNDTLNDEEVEDVKRRNLETDNKSILKMNKETLLIVFEDFDDVDLNTYKKK